MVFNTVCFFLIFPWFFGLLPLSSQPNNLNWAGDPIGCARAGGLGSVGVSPKQIKRGRLTAYQWPRILAHDSRFIFGKIRGQFSRYVKTGVLKYPHKTEENHFSCRRLPRDSIYWFFWAMKTHKKTAPNGAALGVKFGRWFSAPTPPIST